MNLFILTNSDGTPIADKTASAVVAVASSAQVEDLGNVVLGDSEPMMIKFTTGSAAPAFAGDATYSLTASLGAVTTDGSLSYVSTSSFTPITGGWSGRMSLDTSDLIAAVGNAPGCQPSSAFGNSAPRGKYLVLQLQVTDPSGFTDTYALLQIFVEWRVVVTPSTDTNSTTYQLGAVHPRRDITSLTGGGATALDGQATAYGALPTGYTVLLSYGRVGQTWQLIAGTDAEDPSNGIVRPDDYNASSNARIWVQL